MTEKIPIQQPGKRIKRWRWIFTDEPGDWYGRTVWGLWAISPGSTGVTALEIEYEDEPEPEPLPKPWKPGKGEWYWWVGASGGACRTVWSDTETSDNYRYNAGNCFRTEEEAIHHRDVVLPYRELVARLQAAADGGDTYFVVASHTREVGMLTGGHVLGHRVIAGPYKLNTATAIFDSLTDDERELLERGEGMEVDDD